MDIDTVGGQPTAPVTVAVFFTTLQGLFHYTDVGFTEEISMH